MVVDYLADLLGPSSAVVGFKGDYVGFIEIDGDLLEWIV